MGKRRGVRREGGGASHGPRIARPRLSVFRQHPLHVTVRSGDAEIANPRHTSFYWRSGINAKAVSTIEMSTAWFPGWEVRIDGEPAPAGPGTASGLISFQVPPGVHSVQVRYGATATEKTAAGISIAALVVVLAVAILK